VREGYHSAQVDVEVRLNTNESPYPPPPAWFDELIAQTRQLTFNRYPDRGYAELRRAIAGLHGLAPEQVFCANGSNEVLQSLCLAYGGPGRVAVTFEPTYALHSHIAHLTSTAVYEAERDDDFSLDPAMVSAAVNGAAGRGADIGLSFLCSPNNPTGLSDDPAVVERLLELPAGLVVVDEAYGQFADRSAIELLDEDRPLVVTRTFSKTWSMAGVRLGYLLGPAAVVANLDRVALPYHLDALKQAAGRLALRFQGDMDARVSILVAERQRLSSQLRRLPLTVWPSQANFVLFRPTARRGEAVWAGLVEHSVLVRNCASWPRLSDCLRVTVGTPEENDRFLAAMAEVLA
jgi:histidinol-phosphate aminotransferase